MNGLQTIVDTQWQSKCREEDLEYRKVKNECRRVDDHRQVVV